MSDDFVSNVSVAVVFPIRFKLIESKVAFDDASDYARTHRTAHREGLPTGNASLTIAERFPHGSHSGKTLNQELKNILAHLENKIDILINLVAQENDNKGDEYPYEGFCQHLSCSEMVIALPEDEIIKNSFGIQAILSPPTLPPIRVNCTGILSKENDEYKMTFVGLNNDDREDLLSYLIKRERELLRMKKLQE